MPNHFNTADALEVIDHSYLFNRYMKKIRQILPNQKSSSNVIPFRFISLNQIHVNFVTYFLKILYNMFL